VTTPTRTEPPFVPIRHTAWPGRRTPRWALLAVAVLAVAAVAVGLTHKPAPQQRTADLRGFIVEVNTDLQSCAGGVRDVLQALDAISTGASHDRGTAEAIASTGAANCQPANNELIDNLLAYQVPESLFRYHLQAALTGLIDWAAPYAVQVQADAGTILMAPDAAARAADIAILHRDQAKLDAQRTIVLRLINAATAALHPGVALTRLPS